MSKYGANILRNTTFLMKGTFCARKRSSTSEKRRRGEKIELKLYKKRLYEQNRNIYSVSRIECAC